MKLLDFPADFMCMCHPSALLCLLSPVCPSMTFLPLSGVFSSDSLFFGLPWWAERGSSPCFQWELNWLNWCSHFVCSLKTTQRATTWSRYTTLKIFQRASKTAFNTDTGISLLLAVRFTETGPGCLSTDGWRQESFSLFLCVLASAIHSLFSTTGQASP